MHQALGQKRQQKTALGLLAPEKWIERDLTMAALQHQLPAAFDVDAHVEQLGEQLEPGATRRRPVLVGPAGAGKTAIVAELVRRTVQGESDQPPGDLDAGHVVQLNLRSVSARLGADAAARATFEQLLARIATAYPPRILFIEDLHVAVELDWVEPILRFLDRTRQPVLLESRQVGFERLLERHPAADQVLVAVPVEAPDRPRLRGIVDAWHDHHDGLDIDCAALDLATDLAHRYLSADGAAPAAINLLERTLARQSPERTQAISQLDVVDAFTRLTRMPPALVDPSMSLDLEQLGDDLLTWMPGQRDAVNAVVETIALLKAGLARPDRAIGSLLFVGADGPARARCARALTEQVFGSAERLLRLDLSAYNDPAGRRALLGDPTATRPIARQGVLGRRLAQNPCGVLQLDHVEAASPDVLQAIARALELGALVDGAGQRHALTGHILLLTMDGDARSMHASADLPAPRLVPVTDLPSPPPLTMLPGELLRAVDRVVPFHVVDGESAMGLVCRALEALVQRLSRAVPDLAVEIDQASLQWLVDRYMEASASRDGHIDAILEANITSAVARYRVSAGADATMPVRIRLHDNRLVASPMRPKRKQGDFPTTEADTAPVVSQLA